MKLTQMLGAEKAALAYLACASSFEVLERRMPELLSLADYERRKSAYVAENDRAMPELRAELAARRAIGLEVQWLEADELPFIGAIPGANPQLQYALCYGGNGITYSVHAGEIVRAHIEGRRHPLDEVFGFARLPAVALAPARGRQALGT